jgi:hypothetical protein
VMMPAVLCAVRECRTVVSERTGPLMRICFAGVRSCA